MMVFCEHHFLQDRIEQIHVLSAIRTKNQSLVFVDSMEITGDNDFIFQELENFINDSINKVFKKFDIKTNYVMHNAPKIYTK